MSAAARSHRPELPRHSHGPALRGVVSGPGTGENSGERAGVAIERSASSIPTTVEEAPRAEADPFPFWKTVIVSMPQFSMSSITMLLSIHLLNFFLRLGAPTATLTLVITVARSIDLLSDPAVGWATDGNVLRMCGPCRFPRGVRRKPFMLLGAPFYNLFLVLLLGTPFEFEGTGWAVSYGLFNILLYLADTVTHVPYNALLPSLSQDPKQRETIFSFARVINSLGVMFAALAPVPLGMLLRTDECMVDKCAACPFQLPSNQTLGEFCPAIQQGLPLSPGCRCLQACDGECGLQGEREGFRVMGYVFATWHLVAMLLVIIFIEEPAEKELGIKGGLPCLYDAASRARVAALENDGAWKVGGSPTQTSAKVGAAAGSQAGSVELTTPIKKTQAQSVARDGTGGPTIQRSAASTSALAPAADADAGATPPEDEASDMEPIVASINKTFRNKAFRTLIVPWLLDMASVSLLGSMLTLYVTYAVRPTDPTVVPECAGDGIREVFGIRGSIWCSGDSVWLGMGLLALMIGQVAFVPVWRMISNPFGTRNTWLMFNLLAAVTTGLFIFGGVGTPRITVFLSLINGIPMAAMFLNDAIVSQVIDYDANLQGGQRAEARFMLFQSFIPKIISIPASVLPLSALSAFGFVEPVNGVAQPQSPFVVNYVQAVFFGVPTVLSLLSFWYKLSFPIRYDEQLDRIAYNNAVLTGEASAKHSAKGWLRDPLDPSLATASSRSAPACARFFSCCSGAGGLSATEKADKHTRTRAAVERRDEPPLIRAAAGEGASDDGLAGGPPGMALVQRRKGGAGDRQSTELRAAGLATTQAASQDSESSGPGERVVPPAAGAGAPPMARLVSEREEERLRDEQVRRRAEHEAAEAEGTLPAPQPTLARWIPGMPRPEADVPRLSVYERVPLTAEDKRAFFVFDHFSLAELGLWSRFGRNFLDAQVRSRRRTLSVVLLFLALAVAGQIGTGMIESAVLSWVPTISMLSFGLTLGLLVMTHFKVRACSNLRLPMCRAEGRFEKWIKFNAMALQLDCLELELVPTAAVAAASSTPGVPELGSAATAPVAAARRATQ
ncbi:hypothetical protein FNF31_07958 [Cafeteria roenbergensis]|uniref:Uncharacterized protein n=1 Tax=Cafeteria roenbergensis TaxID=33653 RepID=A0A5A8BZA5_CAFRO|nr:hypothetical protein FNF31_07958 [Cafeteria roenbergensis]